MNRTISIRVLVLAASLVFAPSSAQAGAWTLEPGDQFLITTVAYTFGDAEFDDSGAAVSRASPFEKLEGRLFYEYGLSDGLTLSLTSGYTDKAFGPSAEERHHGLAHSSIGLRQRVWKGDYGVASIQGSLRLPGAAEADTLAGESDAVWEADARALFGYGFSVLNRNAFTDVQVGYRARQAFDDEVRIDATVGGVVRGKIQAFLQVFNTISLSSRAARVREHKLQFSTVRPVYGGWSVQSGGVLTVAGQNALLERGVFLSVWRKF